MWIVILPKENTTILLDVHSILENVTLDRGVLTYLTESGNVDQLIQFFSRLTEITQQVKYR